MRKMFNSKEPMESGTKRFIMAVLLSSFLVYTIVVYSFGTDEDKGKDYITPSALKGKALFQEKNCISCHQVYGLGGYLGPDLTNVVSKYKKNKIFINAMLRSGSKRMPNFHLSDEEINSVIDYLEYLDKTGLSPVIKFKINYDGTISEEDQSQ